MNKHEARHEAWTSLLIEASGAEAAACPCAERYGLRVSRMDPGVIELRVGELGPYHDVRAYFGRKALAQLASDLETYADALATVDALAEELDRSWGPKR